MPVTQAMCTSFKQELFEAVHDFTAGTGDTFKIALYTSAATLGPGTTAYTNSGEVVGGGYTAGGVVLTGVNVSTSGTVAIVSFDNAAWASGTFTARAALVYNSSKSNKAVAVLDFGGDKTVSSGNFVVVVPSASADNAVIRMI